MTPPPRSFFFPRIAAFESSQGTGSPLIMINGVHVVLFFPLLASSYWLMQEIYSAPFPSLFFRPWQGRCGSLAGSFLLPSSGCRPFVADPLRFAVATERGGKTFFMRSRPRRGKDAKDIFFLAGDCRAARFFPVPLRKLRKELGLSLLLSLFLRRFSDRSRHGISPQAFSSYPNAGEGRRDASPPPSSSTFSGARRDTKLGSRQHRSLPFPLLHRTSQRKKKGRLLFSFFFSTFISTAPRQAQALPPSLRHEIAPFQEERTFLSDVIPPSAAGELLSAIDVFFPGK